MNPAYDKYDDRHVRDDPSLVTVAEGYVQRYTGDFLLLRELREQLLGGRPLTVAQVRATLNCMRSDPRAGQLPVPARPEGARILRFPGPHTPEDDCVDCSPRRRPAQVRLTVTWNRTLGTSTHVRAEVIHKVDRQRSRITYFPHMTHERFENRFQMSVYWMCGASATRETTQLITAEESRELVVGGLRRRCPGCERRTT